LIKLYYAFFRRKRSTRGKAIRRRKSGLTPVAGRVSADGVCVGDTVVAVAVVETTSLVDAGAITAAGFAGALRVIDSASLSGTTGSAISALGRTGVENSLIASTPSFIFTHESEAADITVNL
jgi:hypothetical protein